MDVLYIVLIILGIILILSFLVAFLIHNKIFGYHYIPDKLVTFYTKEEFNLNSSIVKFKCGKDLLHGEFYYYDNYDNSKLVIVCHGMFSSTRSYMQEVEYFCKMGYKVFTFDYSGTDLSEGKTIKGMANSLRCLDNAINYIKSLEEYNNCKLYIFGHSWGGFATTNIVKYHKDIKAIASASAFISIPRIYMSVLPKYLWVFVPFLVLVEFVKCGKYAFANSVKSIKKYTNDAILIHSTDDQTVNYNLHLGFLKRKITKDNVNFLVLSNKNHNPTYTIEAVNLLNEYATLKSKLSKEEYDDLKKNTNFHKLGELDINIMNQINSIFSR